MRRLTETEVRKLLSSECEAAGSQQEWAERHGISAQYVCDALSGRRALGRKLIDALGLRYIAMYERADR